MFDGQFDRALKRADALTARDPTSEEVKFFRAEFAFFHDAPDLERWVEPLLERSAAGRGSSATSHRLKYAYL